MLRKAAAVAKGTCLCCDALPKSSAVIHWRRTRRTRWTFCLGSVTVGFTGGLSLEIVWRRLKEATEHAHVFLMFFVYHGYPLNKLDWDILKRIQRQQFQNRRVLNHSGDPFPHRRSFGWEVDASEKQHPITFYDFLCQFPLQKHWGTSRVTTCRRATHGIVLNIAECLVVPHTLWIGMFRMQATALMRAPAKHKLHDPEAPSLCA